MREEEEGEEEEEKEKEESQKIDALPVLATHRSCISAMLSSKVKWNVVVDKNATVEK